MTDLNHIALFAKVVDAGSFSAAARSLGLPKATVSRKVAQLESDLNTRLLNRTTRRVGLTAMGRSFYEESVRGLMHFEMARELIAAARAEPSGTLRITAPVSFGSRTLMSWVADFLAAHERIRIELKLTDEPVDPIEARADLAFRVGRLPDSSLIARTLGTSRLILLASPGYLQKRGTPTRIEELQEHDCVIFGQSLDKEVWHFEGPGGPVDIHVRGRIAVDGPHAEVQAALAGLGIALLPVALTAAHLNEGRLQQILPDYGSESGGLHMVYASNRHIPVALRAFLDFVAEKVKQWGA